MGRNFGFCFVYFSFLFDDHAVDGGLTVFGPFGVKIDNVFFITNPGHFGPRFLNSLLLFANLFVHRRDRSIENFFFFLNAPVLINAYDFIGDICRQLRTAIEDTDLEKVGVAHFIDIELVAQHLIRDLARGAPAVPGPLVLKRQLLDDRIKNSGPLNDLENGGRQLRIMDWLVRIALTEDAWIFGGRFNLHENGRLVFARLKISKDGGGDQHQKEGEQNENPTDANYAPVVEKVELYLFVMCHTSGTLLARATHSSKNPAKVNRAYRLRRS